MDVDFLCPLCSCERYEPVLVGANDEQYETGLYRCSGCGFAFVTPGRYTHAADEDLSPG